MIKSKYCIIIFSLAIICANTRVRFSTPGSIMRTPGKSPMVPNNTLIIGSSMEILDGINNYSPAIYCHALNVNGYNFGLSYFSHAGSYVDDTQRPSSLNISVDKQVFNKNNMTVSVGVHDILYDAPSNHRLSLFANFAHYYKINNEYSLESTLGFGTGYLREDSHNYNEANNNSSSIANFFAAIKISTPILKKEQFGMQLLAEYDGWGLNMGVSIPVAQYWTINTGITHFENIAKLNDGGWDASNNILNDAPAIVFGFEMSLPSVNYEGIKTSTLDLNHTYSYNVKNQELDSLIFHANKIIENLEDTLMLQNEEQAHLMNLNQSLYQQINTLKDSLDGMHLDSKIAQNNLNLAMKYLSKSLDGYYAKDYISSLSNVDKALDIFPDLAIAYARKGSIYYKMDDVKRATINWNLALKLDPEYIEVRNILISLKNRSVNLDNLPE